MVSRPIRVSERCSRMGTLARLASVAPTARQARVPILQETLPIQHYAQRGLTSLSLADFCGNADDDLLGTPLSVVDCAQVRVVHFALQRLSPACDRR